MSSRGASDVGLVGGSLEERVKHSRVPPLDLPHVLAPVRRPADDAPFHEFVSHRPLHVEIGFGRAHHLCDLAEAEGDAHVLGFETRREWCRRAAKRAARLGLDNLRVVEGDARPYLDALFEAESVDLFHVLFPDPWWKKRHHKRRLFQPGFVETMQRLLAPGGAVVVKTDVPAYAELIEEQMLAHAGWRLVGTSSDDPVLARLPRSHREKKCAELDIPVFPYRFVKEAP
ncbi:MAG: tRNA (guanosine(46)-N7)-methyltransferase TrmB [Myxococcota bacterium]